MRTVVLASNNKGKIKEFKEMYKGLKILTLDEIGFTDEIEETGKTFLENSLLKAKTISEYLRKQNLEYDVIADDSGLCVDELGGEPGIYSARYASEHGNSAENRKKLLNKLKGISNRKAHFTCDIVVYHPDGTYINVEGKTYGNIAYEESTNKNGFGYDCIFISDDLGKSFADVSSEEKNSVSHRGRALEKLFKEYKV